VIVVLLFAAIAALLLSDYRSGTDDSGIVEGRDLGTRGLTAFGDWAHKQKTDRFTDVDLSSAYSSSGVFGPAFRVRCQEDGMYAAYFSFMGFMDTEPIQVRWRFDDEPPIGIQELTPSANGQAAFLSDSTRTDFLHALVQYDSVAVRGWRSTGSVVDFSISLRGAREAMGELPCLDAVFGTE